MKDQSSKRGSDHVEISGDRQGVRIGRYDATARSSENVTASGASQPPPACEPPDHAV
jgi:hypothetical protein